jgi:hypothetical protein
LARPSNAAEYTVSTDVDVADKFAKEKLGQKQAWWICN